MPIPWSRLGFPLCAFNRHAPIRSQTKWDGKYYLANCRYCGEPIVRKVRRTWIKMPDNLR